MEPEFYSPGRRDFIKKISMGSAFLVFALNFGGCEEIIDAIKNRPTRYRFLPGSAAADAQIAIYKEAVQLMKDLPGTDGRNWLKQAAIHGTAAGGFTNCKHGTEHFVSWHRAYLFYLEKICQKLTGEAGFGLPYWNWAMDGKVPSSFFDAASPLYIAGRSAGPASTPNAGNVSHATMQGILEETNFYLFASGPLGSGSLEATPHNHIHNFVGGTMAAGNSPEDAIFWTHHCMIDYVWFDWNINRGNSNPADPAWGSTSWSHFVDGDGNPATMSALSTVLMPLLSYQYEATQIGTSLSPAPTAGKTDSEMAEIKKRTEKGADVRMKEKERIPFSKGEHLVAGKTLMREIPVSIDRFEASLNRGQDERIIASIGFANFPSDGSYFVRLFLNMPDANPETSKEDPHYAGSFAFFGKNMEEGHDHGGHVHKPNFMVDITSTVQRLKASGELISGKNIQLQFVTVPTTSEMQIAGDTLTIEKLDIVIGDASVTLK